MTCVRVTLTATYEYAADDIDEMTDDEIADFAREAFYLDGAVVSATVDRVEVDPVDDEHVVSSIEACWVETTYRSDGNGRPEYVGGSDTVLHSDGLDLVNDDASYECSCGATLHSWHEVEEHFDEVDR